MFMDKTSPQPKSKKVQKYFDNYEDTQISAYIPTTSPEFMMEEVWNGQICYTNPKEPSIIY
jgi:hypothetical protein